MDYCKLNHLVTYGTCRPCQLICSYQPGWATQVGSVVNNLPASAGDAGDMGLIPGWGRSPEEGNSNSLQDACLQNPMDRGAWRAIVHEVTKSQAQLSN